MDTAGSDFDTILTLYTGSAVNALTSVVANDDVAGENLLSAITTTVTGGTTYLIGVNGYDGDTGNLTLNWDFTTSVAAPTISAISPMSGAVGDLVTVTGSALEWASAVYFNGASAEFSVVSDSELTATVPETFDGPLSVVTPGGSAVSEPFDVLGLDLARFEEGSSGFVFGSGWWSWANAGQSGGSAQVSAVSGSSTSFVFSGSVVRWIGQSGPDRAVAQVSIDGVVQDPVDTYAPTRGRTRRCCSRRSGWVRGITRSRSPGRGRTRRRRRPAIW